MQSQPLIPDGFEWHLSLGNGPAAVLGDAFLFYVAAILLLTYLGAGLSALLFPKVALRYGWLVAPFLGYSLLVATSSLLLAIGANVTISLLGSLVISGTANAWAVLRRGGLRLLGPPRWWGILHALALPSYGISAVSMAHNGSLAYVGPNSHDPLLLFSVAEWLKTHSAPVFAFDRFPPVSQYWDGNLAPLGGWSAEGAHLSSTLDPADVYLLFQRGPIYFESSVGLLLGWDSALVLRPALAFLLSLSLPATLLLSRHLLKVSLLASTLAGLLVGLNGTIFFWVSIAHGGQAAAMFMVPTALWTTIIAHQSPGRLPSLGAALVLSAALASYYQGAPILIALLLPGVIYTIHGTGRWRESMVRTFLMGIGVLLLASGEHARLLQAWASSSLSRTEGWGSHRFPALTDGLGTTLHVDAFRLVTGGTPAGSVVASLLAYPALALSGIAVLYVLLGLLRGKAGEIRLLRLNLLATTVVLAGLWLSDYAYGFLKAQAVTGFLVSVAIALGAEEALRLARDARCCSKDNGAGLTLGSLWLPLCAVAPMLLLTALMAVNLALAAYVFWKPVGNNWNPRAWEAIVLTRLLPAGAAVGVSPNILADPESFSVALYSLREQRLHGPFILDNWPAMPRVFPNNSAGTGIEMPGISLVGASEIAVASGFLPEDRIWTGSLLKLYRSPQAAQQLDLAFRLPEGAETFLPAALPLIAEIPVSDRPDDTSAQSPSEGYLLLTLAAESAATVDIATSRRRYSFRMDRGVSTQSVPVSFPDRLTMAWTGDGRPWLLSAWGRPGEDSLSIEEHYPEVVAVAGKSRLDENDILSDLTYFNVRVPLSHSLDLYDSSNGSHVGWFELPVNPDGKITDVGFRLNGATLEHTWTVSGAETVRAFSADPVLDGEYVACFSVWSGDILSKRIPLYRYRLEQGRVVAFEPFQLFAVWDGKAQDRLGRN